MRIGIVQMDVELENREGNLKRALDHLKEAARRGAEVVCFPAHFLTGRAYWYPKEKFPELAEPFPGPTVDVLCRAAREHSVSVVGGSLFERADGRIYDSTPVVTSRGEFLGAYRRTHLIRIPPIDESQGGVSEGDAYPVFKLGGWTVGVMNDIDLDFPEVARLLAINGAEVIFYPSHCSLPFIDSHRFMSRSRAYENRVFFVDVNRIGQAKGFAYIGDSRILSPKGDVLAGAGKNREGVIVGEIDRQDLAHDRKALDLLSQRRVGTYGDLLRN